MSFDDPVGHDRLMWFRDLHWCNHMKEPFINEYKVTPEGGVTDEPTCPYCGDGYEEDSHPFIIHIMKPGYTRPITIIKGS